MNDSFLSHFTQFADTMREMGYVHYVHNQQLASPATITNYSQPANQPTAHHTAAAAAVSDGDSSGTVIVSDNHNEQQQSSDASAVVVPG